MKIKVSFIKGGPSYYLGFFDSTGQPYAVVSECAHEFKARWMAEQARNNVEVVLRLSHKNPIVEIEE